MNTTDRIVMLEAELHKILDWAVMEKAPLREQEIKSIRNVLAPMNTNDKYPNLDPVARNLASKLMEEIYKTAESIDEPTMPYKNQYLLEKVIEILKRNV